MPRARDTRTRPVAPAAAPRTVHAMNTPPARQAIWSTPTDMGWTELPCPVCGGAAIEYVVAWWPREGRHPDPTVESIRVTCLHSWIECEDGDCPGPT